MELVPTLTSQLTQHATKGCSPGKGFVLQFQIAVWSSFAQTVLTPGPLACRAHRFEATQKRLKSASAQRVEAAEVVAEEKEALDGGRKENSMARLCFVLYPSGKRCQMF